MALMAQCLVCVIQRCEFIFQSAPLRECLTLSANGLKPFPPADDGHLATSGCGRPLASMLALLPAPQLSGYLVS